MIAFGLAAGSKGSFSWGRMDFFLFVTISSWVLVIAIFVLFAFNVISMINVNIDWNLPVRISYYENNYIVEYGDNPSPGLFGVIILVNFLTNWKHHLLTALGTIIVLSFCSDILSGPLQL